MIFLYLEFKCRRAQKKSIAIVGFSSKCLAELATNRDALLKFEPSILTILRSLDLSCGQVNFCRLYFSRQIVIRLERVRGVVKTLSKCVIVC